MKRKDFIQYLSVFIIVIFIAGIFTIMMLEIDSLEKRLNTAETGIQGAKEVFDQAKAIQKHILQRNPKASETAGEISYWIIYCSRKYDIDTGQMVGQIEAESSFNVNAVGLIGERGLMQVRFATWREHGVGSFDDEWDLLESGARYVAWIRDNYGGSPEAVLAAYNTGPGRVNKEYVARHYIQKVNRCRMRFEGGVM